MKAIGVADSGDRCCRAQSQKALGGWVMWIEKLLGGKKPDFPPIDPGAFAKAPKEEKQQGKLF
jgi:hypothetical protein